MNTRRHMSCRSAAVSFSRLELNDARLLVVAVGARFSSRSWAEVSNIAARVSSTANRRSCARQKSRWKSINLNDYRWIGIFWSDCLNDASSIVIFVSSFAMLLGLLGRMRSDR
jgi:hypothetical protein